MATWYQPNDSEIINLDFALRINTLGSQRINIDFKYDDIKLDFDSQKARDKEFLNIKEIIEARKTNMDKKIKKMTKDTQKVVKEEKSLLKADKKRDKFVDAGKKAMMKGKC